MTTTGNPTERMTFAFYGINFDSTKMEDFYHGSRDFLNDLGYFPNKIAVLGIGHTSKMGDFKRIHSRLQKNGFEGVEGFEMLAAPPSATIAICEYVAESMCHRNDNAYAILSVPAVKSDMAKLTEYSTTLLAELNPEYGIGYRRELVDGPTMYAIGLGSGSRHPSSKEEWAIADNIADWRRFGMEEALFRNGILREVYPWNCLSPSQLRKRVGSISLKTWIKKDPSHGTLRQILARTIWEVPESSIPAIRSALTDAKVIFDGEFYRYGNE